MNKPEDTASNTASITATNTGDAWIDHLADQLRQSEDSVDFVVESKLTAARARAIAESPVNPLRHRLNFALTAVAGIALCYLAVRIFQPGFAWNTDSSIPATAQNNMQFEQSIDLPILSSTEDLEFFDSLDFIEWIDSQDLISG